MTGHPYTVFCLRYFPNLVSGEFVNVGVALVTRPGWWAVRIAGNLKDLTCLFPTAQPQSLKSILGKISDRLSTSPSVSPLAEHGSIDDPLDLIRHRTGNLAGSLRWSEPVLEGSTADPAIELQYWFEQLVQAGDDTRESARAPSSESREKPGIRTIMEQEFVRRGVINRLRGRRIEGYFPVKFDYTYENSALNIFEPIGLNYKTGRSIINRAQMWRGKLDILGEQVKTPLAFFALVELPEDPRSRDATEPALTMIRRAQVKHVETIPSEEVERFGQLVSEVVGDT